MVSPTRRDAKLRRDFFIRFHVLGVHSKCQSLNTGSPLMHVQLFILSSSEQLKLALFALLCLACNKSSSFMVTFMHIGRLKEPNSLRGQRCKTKHKHILQTLASVEHHQQAAVLASHRIEWSADSTVSSCCL